MKVNCQISDQSLRKFLSQIMSLLDYFSSPGGTKRKREDDEVVEAKMSKKQKYDRTKQVRKFQKPWLVQFEWLEFEEEKQLMFCKYCKLYPKLAQENNGKQNVMVVGCSNMRIDPLNSHDRSKAHERCKSLFIREQLQETVQATLRESSAVTVTSTPLGKCLQKMQENELERMRFLFNTVFALAKQGKALNDMEWLCSIQEKNGVSIGMNYRNNHRARDFALCIAEQLRRESSKDLASSKFVSVLADGSTDVTISEQVIIHVRYIKDGEILTILVSVEELDSGTGEGIFNGIDLAFQRVDLSMNELCNPQNNKPTLVCANFDGASVMQGHKNGVVSFIAADAPWVLPVHCVAHKLELAALDAVNELPYLKNKFETTVKGIFLFYHYSPKRRREVKEIADMLENDLSHISSVKQVSWLSSKDRALRGLISNYDTVVAHLEHVASRNSSDEANRARGYLRDLKSVKFVTFLHHMSDVLQILSSLSKVFQRSDFLITDVSNQIESHCLKLLSLKTCPGGNLKKFITKFDVDSKTYGSVSLSGTAPDDIHRLEDGVIKYTDKRFQCFSEAPLKCFEALNFELFPDKREELVQHRTEDMLKLLEHFKNVIPPERHETILEQYTLLKAHLMKFRRTNITLRDALSMVLKKPDGFSHICDIIELMLVMSLSTAECERGFSSMNGIKTKLRNSMNQETLQCLMLVGIHGPTVENFNPDAAIEIWMSGDGGKHYKGHKKTEKKCDAEVTHL